MHAGAGASSSAHHHLNVTLGDDGFYYSSQGAGRLPNITNQSGSSSRLRTHLGAEYLGLTAKTHKDRLANMDFNVQNSFAVGGPAFGVREARAPAQQQAAAGGNAGYLLTSLDPLATARLQAMQDSEQAQSRGSRGSGGRERQARAPNKSVTTRAPPRLQTLETSLVDGELARINEAPLSTSAAGMPATEFESYLSKVINSVQHRKRNPRLKSLFNQGSQLQSLEPFAANLELLGDYGSALKEVSAQSQVVPQDGRGPVSKAQLPHAKPAALLAPEPSAKSGKSRKQAPSVAAAPHFNQVSLLGNRDVV